MCPGKDTKGLMEPRLFALRGPVPLISCWCGRILLALAKIGGKDNPPSFTSKTSRVPRLHFPESLTFPGPHGPEQCSLNIQTGSTFRALELRWGQALARFQNPRKQWVAEAKTSEQKNMQIKIKHWRRVSLSWGQESLYPSRSPSCSRGSSPRLVPPECTALISPTSPVPWPNMVSSYPCHPQPSLAK